MGLTVLAIGGSWSRRPVGIAGREARQQASAEALEGHRGAGRNKRGSKHERHRRDDVIAPGHGRLPFECFDQLEPTARWRDGR